MLQLNKQQHTEKEVSDGKISEESMNRSGRSLVKRLLGTHLSLLLIPWRLPTKGGICPQ